LAGDDIIYTASGNDKVEAGAGNDLIIGGDGAGDDVYDGGSGVDTVKYTSATDDITVDLSKATATSTHGGDKAGIGNDKLYKIENVIGGHYNDQLIGDTADNTFTGEKGNDVIDGGAGRDAAVFKGKLEDYTINHSGAAIQITDKQSGRDGSDTLQSIESFSFSDWDVDDLRGSINLLKDSSGFGYAQNSAGQSSSITAANGTQWGDNTWAGWSLRGAETLDGVNASAWEHSSGKLWIAQHNSDWTYIASGGYVSSGSDAYFQAESDFDQDFNDDLMVGADPLA